VRLPIDSACFYILIMIFAVSGQIPLSTNLFVDGSYEVPITNDLTPQILFVVNTGLFVSDFYLLFYSDFCLGLRRRSTCLGRCQLLTRIEVYLLSRRSLV
jgi:hypothetical protein